MPRAELARSRDRLGTGAAALVAGLCCVLGACEAAAERPRDPAQAPAPGPAPAPARSGAASARRSAAERLRAFFEEEFDERLARSPMLQSYLGSKVDYDAWDDLSDEREREDIALTERNLRRLRAEIDPDELEGEDALSYRLYARQCERRIDEFRWRFHDYPLHQMGGLHEEVPFFLCNVHRVDDEADAVAYIVRLNGVDELFEALVERLRVREDMGIVPPRFVFPLVISTCARVLCGAPFDDTPGDSPLLADFRAKVAALALPPERTRELLDEALEALETSVGPAYRMLVDVLESQAARASGDDGVWRLPLGEDYYAYTLGRATTTDASPDEIHALGLREVARIQAEMLAVAGDVGAGDDLRGDPGLRALFAHLRGDPSLQYPSDAAGRAAWLARAQEIVAAADARLDDLLPGRPRTPLVLRAVEPWREASAGLASYEPGTPDGSRAGVYWVNLADLADLPLYQMEALCHHEAVPGHHVQVSLARELEALPRFRRLGGYVSFVEGWALYAERLTLDLDGRGNAYAELGRLSMELWRACRLVVDTGLHHLRWSRERATLYLEESTPSSPGACRRAVERYLVVPGQATAYAIGLRRIVELRALARERLGDAFDLRAFHGVVLGSGPLPLDMLEERVRAWLAECAP